MSLSKTEWPLRKIIWGIYSIDMNSFITRQPIKGKVPLDEFDTYEDAQKHMIAVWTPHEISKWKLEPRPKVRIGANQINERDV